jgi:creatinine amidohydrolase
LHAAGACGNAAAADARRGAQLVDKAARRLIALIDEVARYPLERITASTDYNHG